MDHVEGNFGGVHLGDGTQCSFVDKREETKSQSNEIMLRLTYVRYMSNLNCNLISLGQLAYFGLKTTFPVDLWKMSIGALVVARGKEGNSHCCVWLQWIGGKGIIKCGQRQVALSARTHGCEKGMQVMLTMRKLPELRCVNLESDEDGVFE